MEESCLNSRNKLSFYHDHDCLEHHVVLKFNIKVRLLIITIFFLTVIILILVLLHLTRSFIYTLLFSKIILVLLFISQVHILNLLKQHWIVIAQLAICKLWSLLDLPLQIKIIHFCFIF